MKEKPFNAIEKGVKRPFFDSQIYIKMNPTEDSMTLKWNPTDSFK